MLREMIKKTQKKGKAAKLADTSLNRMAHNELFKKEPEKFKVGLKKRREQRRKANLEKINKIHVKSKKI